MGQTTEVVLCSQTICVSLSLSDVDFLAVDIKTVVVCQPPREGYTLPQVGLVFGVGWGWEWGVRVAVVHRRQHDSQNTKLNLNDDPLRPFPSSNPFPLLRHSTPPSSSLKTRESIVIRRSTPLTLAHASLTQRRVTRREGQLRPDFYANSCLTGE